MKENPLKDPTKYLRKCKECQRNVYMNASDLICDHCQKVDREKLEADKQKKDGRTIQYPAGFIPGGNITYDGKAGQAKLTIGALSEIMKQLGPPPRAMIMPITLTKIDAPLTNTIWMTADIAAAIEEHMTAQKQKDAAADPADKKGSE